jgi:L-lactate dehydrogenase
MGVESQLEIELWPKEVSALQHSAQVLRETIDAVLKANPKAAGKSAKPAGESSGGASRPGPTSSTSGNGARPVRVTMGAGGGNGATGSSRVTISGQGQGRR